MSLLALAARHGRWLLIAGLVTGIALPGLAEGMAAVIVPFLFVMLCVAALREGPRAALPGPSQLPRAMAAALILQGVLPPSRTARSGLKGCSTRRWPWASCWRWPRRRSPARRGLPRCRARMRPRSAC
ncbi:hypothetical protein [Rhodosalinus sp.]|uniref:hypothetical protein n=1 Tax=Rhodosalinus sp. TaxID=2047741 RepID=UPI00397C9EEA